MRSGTVCTFHVYVCCMFLVYFYFVFFFFSSRRRHTRYWRDWSSDVCSSDLGLAQLCSFTVFQLSNRFVFRILFGWNIAIAPCKKTNIESARSYISKALLQRSLICSNIILHCDHIIAHLPERTIEDRKSTRLN